MEREIKGNPRDGILVITKREGFTHIEVTPPEGYFQERTTPAGDYRNTPMAREKIPEKAQDEAARMFLEHGWGSAEAETVMLNQEALECGHGLVMGVYDHEGTEFWVERHGTGAATVMMPSEH